MKLWLRPETLGTVQFFGWGRGEGVDGRRSGLVRKRAVAGE